MSTNSKWNPFNVLSALRVVKRGWVVGLGVAEDNRIDKIQKVRRALFFCGGYTEKILTQDIFPFSFSGRVVRMIKGGRGGGIIYKLLIIRLLAIPFRNYLSRREDERRREEFDGAYCCDGVKTFFTFLRNNSLPHDTLFRYCYKIFQFLISSFLRAGCWAKFDRAEF